MQGARHPHDVSGGPIKHQQQSWEEDERHQLMQETQTPLMRGGRELQQLLAPEMKGEDGYQSRTLQRGCLADWIAGWLVSFPTDLMKRRNVIKVKEKNRVSRQAGGDHNPLTKSVMTTSACLSSIPRILLAPKDL